MLLAFLRICGVDVWGWLQQLWDTVTEISFGYIVLGCLFQGLQTTFTALGWYGILNYAYRGQVTFMPVLASYAAGVALNNFLPANIGTLVTLLMYVAIIERANFPGVLAGYVVQKIFYFVIGTLIYIYLFAEVAGSFSFQFGGIRDAISGHWVLIIVIVLGGGFLIYVLLRFFWAWFKKMWAKAKEGAAILGDLHAYLKSVLLPQVLGYVAKVLVIIVFLAAYSIPITFGSVMSVLGSNQLANILSLTPGGVGINQAFNSFALDELHELDHRDRVLDRPAADHDGLQRPLRGRPDLHRLRLERRLPAGQGVLRRREGAGARAEGEAEAEARRGRRGARVVGPRPGVRGRRRFAFLPPRSKVVRSRLR